MKNKLTAEGFLAYMAGEFPGLFIECDESEAHDILLDVSGADLVEWISSNREHLKTNTIGNLRRIATMSIAEHIVVEN